MRWAAPVWLVKLNALVTGAAPAAAVTCTVNVGPFVATEPPLAAPAGTLPAGSPAGPPAAGAADVVGGATVVSAGACQIMLACPYASVVTWVTFPSGAVIAADAPASGAPRGSVTKRSSSLSRPAASWVASGTSATLIPLGDTVIASSFDTLWPALSETVTCRSTDALPWAICVP